MDYSWFSIGLRSSLFVFLIMALPLVLCADDTLGADSPFPNATSVHVGVWVVNVQRFDLSTGSYDLDFFLWFSSPGKPVLVNYEFMNGEASSIEVEEATDDYLEVRVRGTFLKSLDFRSYPFDSHHLTIEIEDRNASMSELVFVPDVRRSGFDSEANVPGWRVEKWRIESEIHSYPGNETFSRIVFTFTLNRLAYSSLLKTVVPISVITSIALLAFLVPPSKHGQRIALGVTTLTAAAANHLTLANQIPTVGYLTLFDKVMITSYGLFLYSLVVSVVGLRMVEQNEVDLATRLSRITGLLIPVVVFAVFGSLLIFF